jgi:uncharacterized protein (TIGR02118 family)
MYPNTPGARFDLGYYCDQHTPMVRRRLGEHCKHYTVEKGLEGISPGSGAAYVVISHFFFDSLESFRSAFSPHSAEIMGDFAHYTNVVPLIQISEVIVDEKMA